MADLSISSSVSQNNATAIMNPTVSIGMLAYNGEKYIEAAIKSLLSQTYSDFELIISDDGSKDSTSKICEAYAAQDSRIIYIRHNKNIGPGPNFMHVLGQANGKYFMWAAHDDCWAPNWIETLIGEIRPSDASIRGIVRFIANDNIVVDRKPANYKMGQYYRIFMGKETTQNARNLYIYGLFLRKTLLSLDLSVLLRNGYSWDFIFVFQLIEKGDLRCSDKTYQLYRLHPESDGSQVMSRYKTWQRLVFKVQPLTYYQEYYRITRGKTKLIIIALTPIKHIYNQLQLWWRAFRKIILKLENI